MKKCIIICLVCVVGITNARAQFLQQTTRSGEPNWQNLSPEEDGVYGAAINKAQESLSGMKPKKTVTVAIIGPGLDIEHEDLAGSIWTNPKERPNGRDDDRNGLVDDLHGWNFLGGPGGEIVDNISRTSDREFFRLAEKENYPYFIRGLDGFYIMDKESGTLVKTAPPADIAEYEYFRHRLTSESRAGSLYLGYTLLDVNNSFIPQIDRELKEKYGDAAIGHEEFMSVALPYEQDTLRAHAMYMMAVYMASYHTWDGVKDLMLNILPVTQAESVNDALARTLTGQERGVIGDDPEDINDRAYGNNNLLADNSGKGTLLAGIIGARRGNDIGIDGIADNVRIMALRIEGNEPGEPYVKDMALAIRYAVDNGADIIQLGKSNTLYPLYKSGWVDDALVYAEEKGVLVVMPVVDMSYDMGKVPFYPNRFLTDGKTLTNFITVAASDSRGNPLIEANFGRRELDVFAPGVDIYSTYLGDTYRMSSGSDMAASVVTGIAALIKAYYPSLDGTCLRELLMDTVTKMEDSEIEKQYVSENGLVKDLFTYDEISVSGGIVNAAKALEAAAELVQ